MRKALSLALLSSCIFACSHSPENSVPLAEDVDLSRFMGDWYVIANIPTFIEKNAFNAIERYEMDEKGRIHTTFTFYDRGFDGKLKTYHPTGFVSETSNSVWGMQFIWPIKAEFLIAYVSEDYQHTIIARNARDYVWIMARTPEISETSFQSLLDLSESMGYEVEHIQKVPQKWARQP